MHILMLYPRYPDTFWSFRHALKFISRKATDPPLGLLTVAAMLPEDWHVELLDLNVSNFSEQKLRGVDLAFISSMSVQRQSARDLIKKCRSAGVPVVAGGPMFTSEWQDFPEVDYFVLNEAELTFPAFIEDYLNGKARRVYETKEFADLTRSPIPRWELLQKKSYASMDIQFSRGCPFACEFCEITSLLGRKVRGKSVEQIISELESLYQWGWRGNVFFVDDNFIALRSKLKREILPAVQEWMDKHGHPFSFYTQASIDLADDRELMKSLTRAGFEVVFIGIETTNPESLKECQKIQNSKRDLMQCVKTIQSYGLQVQGGFIVGFDHDSPSVFTQLTEFIDKSGIISAMVGLLNAPKGTRLYRRLQRENRLIREMSGNNTDFTTNFIPRMNFEKLLAGYRQIIRSIYAPKPYYERVCRFIEEFRPDINLSSSLRLNLEDVKAFLKSIWILGIVDHARVYYWKLLLRTLFKRPKLIRWAVTFSIYGYHYRQIFKDFIV